MGLVSALNSALTGLAASATRIDNAANNIANAKTTAFKATSNSSNQGQGALETGRSQLDLAIQGKGFFLLEGDGTSLFTRDGAVSLSARGEFVNSQGQRFQGYGVDGQSNLMTTSLEPLALPTSSSSSQEVHLENFEIDASGTLQGRFSDGTSRVLGQLALASFANPSGLIHQGGNTFREGPNSGAPQVAAPGSGGNGTIVRGALESSNTDLGAELAEVSLSSLNFRANLQVIDTVNGLLDELLFLDR